MENKELSLSDEFFDKIISVSKARIYNSDVSTALVTSVDKEYDLTDITNQEDFLLELDNISKRVDYTGVLIYDENNELIISIDCQHNWLALVIYDKENDCLYIPFNKTYKNVKDIAPVKYEGQSFVYKRDCFDDAEYVTEGLKYLFKHKKISNNGDLLWQKSNKK